MRLFMTSVYLDFHVGDEEEHSRQQARYDATEALLTKNALIYGLPMTPSELSEEQRDIIKELDVHISIEFSLIIE